LCQQRTSGIGDDTRLNPSDALVFLLNTQLWGRAMRRREFIALSGGAAAAWPIMARAQQPARISRVGYLGPATSTVHNRPFFGAFRQRLQELGYVEGRNLVLDVRRADGHLARLPGLAAELVSLRPDVIVAGTTHAISAAQKATSSIPIVMLPAADPIGSGFVKSLAKPGGNITGLSSMTADLTVKSLELLLVVVPSKRIAVLMSPNPVHASQVKELHAPAQALGLKIVPVTAIAEGDLEEAFERIATERCDGLIVLSDHRVTRRIVELAAKTRLPAIYQVGDFVRMGGLLSYGPDFVDLFRRGAEYVDRILKGAAPAEMPVEQPAKFELLINPRTARALSLSIPESILVRADEVIE
jgi:putative tryptophan/tyrosine transport system substrate-binding protein